MLPDLEANRASNQELVDAAKYEVAMLSSDQGMVNRFHLLVLS